MKELESTVMCWRVSQQRKLHCCGTLGGSVCFCWKAFSPQVKLHQEVWLFKFFLWQLFGFTFSYLKHVSGACHSLYSLFICFLFPLSFPVPIEGSIHYKVQVAAVVAVSLIVIFIVGVLLVFLLTRCRRHERSTVSLSPHYLPGFLASV